LIAGDVVVVVARVGGAVAAGRVDSAAVAKTGFGETGRLGRGTGLLSDFAWPFVRWVRWCTVVFLAEKGGCRSWF
jgi:hypothetical protein